MKILKKITRKRDLAIELFWTLLAHPTLRLHYCRLRFYFLKKNLKFYPNKDKSIYFNKETVDYNAVFHDAAFGCGGRMAILLHPLIGLFYPNYDKKLLIVGPRTEDDILWAKALGLKNVSGLDLFSYSPYIEIGDAHNTSYLDNSFDAVILSWILPYTKNPADLINEMKRITKDGGYLILGWHWSSYKINIENNLVRCNTINEFSDVRNLIGGELQIAINPTLNHDHHKAIFTKVIK